jgi:hypothetical protein
MPHTYADYFIQKGLTADKAATGRGLAQPVGPNLVQVTSTVQTTDLSLGTYPPGIPLDINTGAPSGASPTNVDPFWSHNGAFIVFSSNRNLSVQSGILTSTITANYHLYAISSSGDPSTLEQLTSGSGNERWPTLLGPNDNQIAFCESAAPGGDYMLETAPLVNTGGQLRIGPATSAASLMPPGVTDVEHPSYGAGVVVFAGAATPLAPHHIFSITIGSGSGSGVVQQLTTGQSDDRNPSASQTLGNSLIAFQSNSTGWTPNITVAPQVSAGEASATGNGDPIYGSGSDNIYVMFYLGSVTPQRVSDAGGDNITPAWSDTASANEILYWASTGRIDPITGNVDSHHQIVSFSTTVDSSGQFLDNVEASPNNLGTIVNVSDNQDISDNVQPASANPASFPLVVYTSNRYLVNGPNDNPDIKVPNLDVEPFEELIAPNHVSPLTVGTTLELMASRLDDNLAPTLLNFSNSEIIHIEDTQNPGVPVRDNIIPGHTLKFTVRASDRQSGVKEIWLQIKVPNSKYQDPAGLEHRVYTRPGTPDEAGTLYGQAGTAVGGFDGNNAIQMGNLIPQNGASATVSTAATAGATTIVVNGNGAGFNQGDEVVIGNGGDREVGFVELVTTAAGPPPTATITVPNLRFAHPIGETVKDSAFLVPVGHEVDCDAVDLSNTALSGSFDPTTVASFHVPTYTPGFEDAVPHSAAGFPRQSYWLQLTAIPNNNPDDEDNDGGVTFTGTWKTPQSYPSDYYIDTILYDDSSAGENWQIYDNVWGFSTSPQPAPTGSSVLVVNDYALPQKFFSRFGSVNGTLNNVPINFYGAESYVTDMDVNMQDLANGQSEAVLPHVAVEENTGTTPWVESFIEQFSDLTEALGEPGGRTVQQVSGQPLAYAPQPGYANGLGVNSYGDGDMNQANIASIDNSGEIAPYGEPAPVPASQSYSIWRILSRGPIPTSTLLQFAPLQGTMPNPANPTTQVPVLISNSCVFWVSPFSGDEFVSGGTITDPSTQQSLDAFLNANGRLEIEGIDIGFALNNGVNSSFYTKDLHAQFVEDAVGYNPGTMILSKKNNAVPPPQGPPPPPFFPDYFEHDAYGNDNNAPVDYTSGGVGHSNFMLPTGAIPYFSYTPPNNSTLTIGNLGFAGSPPNLERNDTSMNASDDLTGFIDADQPTGSAITEIFGVIPQPPNDPQTQGNQFLLFNGGPNGSMVLYGNFGLEALSQEVIKFQPAPIVQGGPAPPPIFVATEDRSNLIHNAICMMRTGQISGNVISTGTGSGPVAGALVEATQTGAPYNIGGTYTAFTDNAGNFTISGVPPGEYQMAVLQGGAHTQGTNLIVHGGDTASGLKIAVIPPPPGTLQVTVENAANNSPIQGVTVTATQIPGGNTLQPQTTGGTGVATFANAAAATYSVIADGTAVGFSVSNPVQATVTSGNLTSITIKLTAAPATVYGLVTQGGNPVVGATVKVLNSSNQLIASTATVAPFTANGSGEDGGQANYTIPGIPAGSGYTVEVSLTGFTAAPITGVTLANNQKQRENFALAAAQPEHVLGLVTDNNGNPITGATVIFMDASNVQHTVMTTAEVTVPMPGIGGQTKFNYGVDQTGTPNFTLLQGNYTAQATANGLNPSPVQQVQVQSDPTIVNFENTNGVQTLHAFQPGLTLFSVPFDYTNSGLSLSQIFGYANPKLAVWNTGISQYAITPTPPANTITLGQGYWAWIPGLAVLAPGGSAASPSSPFSITLKPGWNMIGDPFISPVNIADFEVFDSHGNGFSWANATKAGVHMVSPTLYSYNTATGQYDPHYVGSTVGKPADLNPTLNPYVGYWIEAFTTTALQISPPPTPPSNLAASVTTVNNAPAVMLTWTAGTGATSYNVYRGTTSGAETLLTSGVPGTTFTDSSVTTGTTYFYVVASASAAGQSLNSNEASASP